jgi:hypothetical protein
VCTRCASGCCGSGSRTSWREPRSARMRSAAGWRRSGWRCWSGTRLMAGAVPAVSGATVAAKEPMRCAGVGELLSGAAAGVLDKSPVNAVASNGVSRLAVCRLGSSADRCRDPRPIDRCARPADPPRRRPHPAATTGTPPARAGPRPPPRTPSNALARPNGPEHTGTRPPEAYSGSRTARTRKNRPERSTISVRDQLIANSRNRV